MNLIRRWRNWKITRDYRRYLKRLGRRANWTFESLTDNYGQIVLYTGLYKWTDGSVHDEPE